jgi:polyhydroxyalkanoate synthesis regulator phasin
MIDDIELINTPDKPYINDDRINSFYKDLVLSFLWVNNPQGETKIKQCIDNIMTSVYQNGQMDTQHRLNKEILTLRNRIKELEDKYEPRQKDQDRGYNKGKYTGD